MIQYAHISSKNDFRFDMADCSNYCVKCGYVRLYQWLFTIFDISKDSIYTEYMIIYAHVYQLDWNNGSLHQFQWKSTRSMCSMAATYGHLSVLQWLIEHGCDMHKEVCSIAALNGHLNILQWARANGCPWDIVTCIYAATGGHLNILQWAIENGAECDKQVCEMAKFHGQNHILAWLHRNKCPYNCEEGV